MKTAFSVIAAYALGIFCGLVIFPSQPSVKPYAGAPVLDQPKDAWMTLHISCDPSLAGEYRYHVNFSDGSDRIEVQSLDRKTVLEAIGTALARERVPPLKDKP